MKRPHMPTTITSHEPGITTTMALEHPHGISAPMYRVTALAFGLAFVALVDASSAVEFESRLTAQLRGLLGRAQVTADLLSAPVETVQAAVAEAMLAGVDPDTALDRLALEAGA